MDDLRFKSLRAKLLRKLWKDPDAKPLLTRLLSAVDVGLDSVLEKKPLTEEALCKAALAVAPEVLLPLGLDLPKEDADRIDSVLTWRVFVAWDMSDSNCRVMLEEAESWSAEAPAPGEPARPLIDPALKGSSITVAEKVRKGVLRADRLVAIVDEHNANVAYEVGLALGSGVFVSFGSKAKTPSSPWTLRRPNKDLLLAPARTLDDLRALAVGDDAIEPPPISHGTRGAAFAFLCPGSDSAGSGARSRISRLRRNWQLVNPDEWSLLEIPRLLERYGRLIWVITPSDHDRDGPENTDHGILAGLLDGLGAKLDVLQKFSGPPERRILDVGAGAKDWKDIDALAAIVQSMPSGAEEPAAGSRGGPPRQGAAPFDPARLLATWRSVVRASHARLGGRHVRLIVEQVIPLRAESCFSEVGARSAVSKTPAGTVPAAAGWPEPEIEAAYRATTPGTLREIIDRISPQKPARLILLGAPGAGKTTTCRRLAWELADNPHGPLGIFVSLLRWTHGVNPFDLAAEDLGEGVGKDEASAFAGLLRDEARKPRRVWLFLDGWDEVVEGPQRSAISKSLAAFTTTYPEAVVVLTSRRTGYDRRAFPPEFDEWSLLPLSPKEQRLFLDARLPDRASEVLRGIDNVPLLRDLARSPLMLGLIADLVHAGVVTPSTLPRRRTELFRAAIGCLLARGQSDAVPGIAEPDTAQELLGHLSLALNRKGGESWPGHDLFALGRKLQADKTIKDSIAILLAPWNGSIERFLRDVATSSGILAPAGEPTNLRQPWTYLHRAFRESLAAECLAAVGPKGVDALISELGKQSTEASNREDGHRSDRDAWIGRWGEVLAFLVGSIPAARGLAIVDALAKVEKTLAFRALAEVDKLSVKDGLERFFAIEGGDGDHLRDCVEAWSAPLELDSAIEAAVAWAAARDKAALAPAKARRGKAPTASAALSAEQHAFVLYALEHVVRRRQPADLASLEALRKRYFAALPRWSSAMVPELRRLRVPEAGDSVTFLMGSPEGEGYPDEHPQHPVTLSPFELSVVPVTWDAYRPFDRSEAAHAHGKDHPVNGVSWWLAWLFCRWVGGRLPTEAEWECACRAGTTTPWSTGADEESLSKAAWYEANSKNVIHPVGTKAPNPWGFHDLHGNVWEWCADRFGPYPKALQRNPTGPASGAVRVLRGGCCLDVAGWCRSACRRDWGPGLRFLSRGFRVAFPAFPPSLVNLEPSSFED